MSIVQPSLTRRGERGRWNVLGVETPGYIQAVALRRVYAILMSL
ncbi:MAG: hypothetical protein NZ823_15055 [Blastocatellia bacterium]|nr:hypothetical protein [Blastocatellia bacterium]